MRHEPRGGYQVTTLSGPELHELYLVRGALEAAATEAATAAAGPEDDQRAEQIHHDLVEAIRDDDVPRYQAASRAFHETLLAPCGMPRLMHMLDLALNLTEPAQAMSMLTPAQRARLQSDHTRMLDAFLRRDSRMLSWEARGHHNRLTAYVDAARNRFENISAT